MRFDGNPGNPYPNGWWLAHDPAMDLRHDHVAVFLAVLSQQLTAARAGTLTPAWRDTIDNQPPPPLQKCDLVTPPHWNSAGTDHLASTCLMYAEPPAAEASRAELLACARRDVAALPIAAWEPHAAGGDWETALRAWLNTSLDVNTHRQALARRADVRHQQQDNTHSRLYQRTRDLLREDHQIARDLLVASSAAAASSATGTYPNAWRNLLADRSHRWQDQDRAAAYRLALLDVEAPSWASPYWRPHPDDPYAWPNFRTPELPGPIPEYWTAPHPAQSA
ncbi:MAG: hypothetical protein E6R04_10780 [Spirochaetes bacterium]|nr:MAG: hypothetical protein E6R04_10780 [Spirochaetota bacterium]